MIIDATDLRPNCEVQASVCIVGSGPAGIVVAHELDQASIDAVIVESGGSQIDGWAQTLNEGPIVGDPYAGLGVTRHRQLGGTVHAWNTPVRGEIGAKYVPLEPWDLDRRDCAGDFACWPLPYEELEKHYREAQMLCALGPLEYGIGSLVAAGRRPFELDGPDLTTKIYQFGSADAFLLGMLRKLETSSRTRVVTGLTVCDLEREAGERMAGVQARTRRGDKVRIRSRFTVLAGGAIENARLLLLARQSHPGMLADIGGWLGRCFMEHPRDTSMVLLPCSPDIFERARSYDACEIGDAHTVCGRIAFRAGPPAGSRLPNMSITLQARLRPDPPWWKRLRRGTRIGPKRGYGWSAEPELAKWFDGFRLLINLEQHPNPENRILLSSQRDALGQPRAELHWRWRDDEQAALCRLRRLVAAELEAAGLGTVVFDDAGRPDPNAHHHAGTTRMAESPATGVVDPNARVFGTDNLFVAGASVFPTAGFANPTLTIVALASRLAGHLRWLLVERADHATSFGQPAP